MIRKIGKIVATFIGGIIPALMLMLVMSSIAWALSGGTGVALKNGQIGLVNDTGGIATDLPTAASTLLGGTATGDIFYANADATVARLEKGTDGEVLKLASGIPSWAAETTAAFSKSLVTFTSETSIDLGDTEVLYMGAGGRLCASTAEAKCVTPIQTTASFQNLICYASGAVGGTSLTVAFGDGDCTTGLTYGSLASVPTGTTPVNSTNTEAVTGGQCFALKITSAGNTNAVHINCTAEKIS